MSSFMENVQPAVKKETKKKLRQHRKLRIKQISLSLLREDQGFPLIMRMSF